MVTNCAGIAACFIRFVTKCAMVTRRATTGGCIFESKIKKIKNKQASFSPCQIVTHKEIAPFLKCQTFLSLILAGKENGRFEIQHSLRVGAITISLLITLPVFLHTCRLAFTDCSKVTTVASTNNIFMDQ